jgi:hypothetical protein
MVKPDTPILDDKANLLHLKTHVCMRRTSDPVRQITDILSGQKDSYSATNYLTM